MRKLYVLALLLVVYQQTTIAQLSLTAQLRTRTELRDGFGAPLPKNATPAFFTTQRSRVTVGYQAYRLKFGVALQDVRIWGQDVSTFNRTTSADNNAIMLHEAWAEMLLSDTAAKSKTLSLKIGRQELVYDDQRLLGNLDWAQQARRHDAAVLKFENKSWMLHLAGAFNQNKEGSAGTIYNSNPAGNYAANTNGGTMYKSMAFVYAGKKLKSGSASFLFLTDQFSKYKTDTVNNTAIKTFEPGSWGRATTGFYVTNTFKQFSATASAYYQFGKNAASQKLSAVLLSGYGQYAFSKKVAAGAGIDYTSGGVSGSTSKAFDPLYGTPHKFWGLMDYFYAGNGFGSKGLKDYYIKTKYKPSAALAVSADVHTFYSASNIMAGSTSLNKHFGSEIDVVANYSFTKIIGFEAGYSHFFSTASMVTPAVKNVGNAQSGNNWAYLMINIKPDFLSK